MNRRQALLASATLAIGATPKNAFAHAGTTSQDQARATVVGAWRLISVATVRPNGAEVTDWAGPKPTGILMYSADGYMSVHIVRDPPARWPYQNPEEASVAERAHAFDRYYAYFGRYSVDLVKGVVTHQVEGALEPNEVGVTYERKFRLENDRLALQTEKFTLGGEQVFNKLVWQRVAAV
jgi:hypothetical protein